MTDHVAETYLAIDFETTGLYPSTHVPLEVRACVFDHDFTQLAPPVHRRVDQPHALLDAMEPKVREMHLQTGLVEVGMSGSLYVPGGVPWASVIDRLTSVFELFADRKLILLGSNPTFDRGFLPAELRERLHHRQLDVRSVMMALGTTVPWVEGRPEMKHTAAGDMWWAIDIARQARAVARRAFL